METDLGVEDGKLGKHPHVSSFQSQSSFQQRNELVGVALSLVQSNEGLPDTLVS